MFKREDSLMGNNIVDFHIHAFGSVYKDSFATASYDQVCAHFQNIAEEQKANITIAITEHDVNILTYDEYKRLCDKYPNVKIIPGMESNCKLGGVTDGIFERAHILTYADVSNEENLKKWFDCQELKDISEIRLSSKKDVLPSNSNAVKNYCNLLNTLYGTKLDSEYIASEFANTNYTDSKQLMNKAFDLISKYVAEKWPFYGCKNQCEIKRKLRKLNIYSLNKNASNLTGINPNCYIKENEVDRIKIALSVYNNRFSDKLNYGDFINYSKNFNNTSDMSSIFVKFISEALLKNPYYTSSINSSGSDDKTKRFAVDAEEIEAEILKNTSNPYRLSSSDLFDSKCINYNIGELLYVAKSILNKHCGLKITNHELALILDKSKSISVIKKEFIEFVRIKAFYNNADLYQRIKSLDYKQLSNYVMLHNKFGDITLNALLPDDHKRVTISKDDIRTPLSEIDEIVKKTGAHLILAHPNSIFSYSETAYINGNEFKNVEKQIMPKSTYAKIIGECSNNGRISTQELNGVNNILLKMELFFKKCKEHDIHFEGFEITKSDFKDTKMLLNKLIYAAKNDLEVSFGSDTHLSSLHYYYDKFKNGKIDQTTFKKLCDHAYAIKDTTIETQKYKDNHLKILKPKTDIKTQSRLVLTPILKNKKIVYPNKDFCFVTQTSFSNKIFNKEIKSRDMLSVMIGGFLYKFARNTLKDMNYQYDGESPEPTEKSNNEPKSL